jgi:hypothetical protein
MLHPLQGLNTICGILWILAVFTHKIKSYFLLFFWYIKYTENASIYAGLKGIKPVKLSTLNVKNIYSKRSGKALKKEQN